MKRGGGGGTALRQNARKYKESLVNPIALRKAKIVCNFGLSECNRVKVNGTLLGKATLWLSILPPFQMGSL